jgi:RND family efflux transporter MFP subunit
MSKPMFAGRILLIATTAASLSCMCACSQAPESTGAPSGDKNQTAAKSDNGGAETSNEPMKLKVVKVQQHVLNTELDIPGQLLAYQDVPIHAKMEGYISWIGVDRGSVVKKGQLLVTITAPELDARVSEAKSKLTATESSYAQSQSDYESQLNKQAQTLAKLQADKLTWQRLAEAAKTPGAIAQNEVDLAQKAVEADQALLDSIKAQVAASLNLVDAQKQNVQAAKEVLKSQQAFASYLQVRAPFDGVITDRNKHEGSMVSVDTARMTEPMLRIQQKDLLRLVVAVPEAAVAGVKCGGKVDFTVPAFPGKEFSGTIARLGYALDEKTRTMPVELDVPNKDGALEPGMFATVSWPVTRPYATLFVPPSAVTDDLKGTFVLRVHDGVSDRLKVARGWTMNDLVEIIADDLQPGDTVALKATDEVRSGTRVAAVPADEQEVKNAGKHLGAGGE